jgi:hypothetical protein
VHRRAPRRLHLADDPRRDVVGTCISLEEHREQVRDLVPLEDGIVQRVDVEHARQHRRRAREAPQLAASQQLVDVQDLIGRDAHEFATVGTGLVLAGMLASHPVRDALADCVELDARLNRVSVASGRVELGRALLALDDLQLQRHREPVGQATRAQAHEHLASLMELTPRQPLQAVEVEHAVGVALLAERSPELLL